MSHPVIKRCNYHTWANRRIFGHLDELPDEVYGREIESVFSSVSEVITHIYQVDGMWLSVMSGNSFEDTMKVIKKLKSKSADAGRERMRELYGEVAGQYESFLREEDVDRVITITHPTYGDLDVAVADMVDHVINHGTYHRGNITAMLRQQGHPGVPTDYIIYLNELA